MTLEMNIQSRTSGRADFLGRSLLTLEDLSRHEIETLADIAVERKALKRGRIFPLSLKHRNIAVLFTSESVRTVSSYLVAGADEGANMHQLNPAGIRFGISENIADIARVISRMYDGMVYRGLDPAVTRELARSLTIPLWIGSDDSAHPNQGLADYLTFREIGLGIGARICFIGNGAYDVVRTLIPLAAKVGFDLRVVTPAGHEPEAELIRRVSAGAHPQFRCTVTNTPAAGLHKADVVYGDMWGFTPDLHDMARMGKIFSPYRITREFLDMTGNNDVVLMHDLPACHSRENDYVKAFPDMQEIADDVFEWASSNNRIFDQAENKMHAAKAVMVASLFGSQSPEL
jgi:ornithine carbamoyltransferase